MKKKILIVDEDPLNRKFFRDVLASEGFDTIMSGEGDDAPALARAEKPDLIVLDMCAPDDGAFAATRKIKNDHRLTGIPVIGVTASARAYHYDDARAEGCEECLQKPISVHGFLRSVNRHLN